MWNMRKTPKLLKTWNNELFLGMGGPKNHPKLE